MAGWTVSAITGVPTVSDGDPDDPAWYPLQHALGIDTFGVNLFVATHAEQTLVEEHDERGSGQQELYLILQGKAVFDLDGEQISVEAGGAVAVTDPTRRSAKALSSGTRLLVIGAPNACRVRKSIRLFEAPRS
jgi:quercetin dioxygenase-like cupin family protein